MTLRRRRPSTRSSPPGPSRSTSTRRSSTPRATRCRSCGSSRRTSSSPTSSRSRPRWPPSSRACPGATLIPHVYPARPTRASRSTRSAPACHARALGRRMWRRARPIVEQGLERGRARAQPDTRRGSGLPPLDSRPRRHQPTSSRSSATFPQLEYPRTWPGHVHVVGPLMWEPPADGAEPPAPAPPRTIGRSCSSRPPPPRTPSTGCCAPRCAASPTRPSGCSRRGTGALPPRPLPVPENAPGRRVGLLLADDAALRRRRLPRRATARSPGRSPAAAPSSPARRRRHERERRPRGLGRRGRAAAPTLRHAAVAAPRRRTGARRAVDPGAGQGARRLGGRARPRREAAVLVERLAAQAATGEAETRTGPA